MIKRTIILALVCAAISACQGGASGTAIPAASPAPASIDSVVEQYYQNSFGVELAIYKHGTLVYGEGYGLRDRGLPDTFSGTDVWNIEQPDKLLALPRGRFAPDINTIFDLASLSKPITAGAILLLQQDGKLSVSDPLSKYFPAFPKGDEIPLLYLLQQRSGLVNYNNFGARPDFSAAYADFMASGQTNYQPIVDRLASFPLQFAPGTQYQYSNSNYVLLGMIVARVSGEPLGAFLQQRIFGPLSMTRTQQGYPSAPATDLALGYEVDNGTVCRAWQWNLAWLAGSGGLTSTVGDVEKWDAAVRQAGIFTQASLAQMFAPSPLSSPFGGYADGWFISQLDGHSYVWHAGSIGGFQTLNAMFPDVGIDIIVLSNDGTGRNPYYIIPQIFPLALRM